MYADPRLFVDFLPLFPRILQLHMVWVVVFFEKALLYTQIRSNGPVLFRLIGDPAFVVSWVEAGCASACGAHD